MAENDELTGTEMVARAFHKHLRGVPVYLSASPDSPEVKIRLGNYVLTFDDQGEGTLLIRDVSDAR